MSRSFNAVPYGASEQLEDDADELTVAEDLMLAQLSPSCVFELSSATLNGLHLQLGRKVVSLNQLSSQIGGISADTITELGERLTVVVRCVATMPGSAPGRDTGRALWCGLSLNLRDVIGGMREVAGVLRDGGPEAA